MVIELVTDVKMKIKSIQYMRSMFHTDVNYQVGEIMYEIRKKFKRMVYVLQSSAAVGKNQVPTITITYLQLSCCV